MSECTITAEVDEMAFAEPGEVSIASNIPCNTLFMIQLVVLYTVGFLACAKMG